MTSANVPELNSLLIKQVFSFSNDFPVILFTFLASLTVVLVRWWRYNNPSCGATRGGDNCGRVEDGNGQGRKRTYQARGRTEA